MTAKRIETPLNSHLSEIIPVIYGAVLSYGLYVFAQIIVGFWRASLDTPGSVPPGILTTFLCQVSVFIAVVIYMIQDVGEIIKLSHKFPFLRTSRYSQEIFIAFWYLITFAFISAGSYLAVLAFGFAVFFGGIWYNQIKEEYKSQASLLPLLKTVRGLQYAGGSLFLIEGGTFLALERQLTFERAPVVCFISTFLLWIITYEIYPSLRYGAEAHELLVNTVLPDRFLIRD